MSNLTHISLSALVALSAMGACASTNEREPDANFDEREPNANFDDRRPDSNVDGRVPETQPDGEAWPTLPALQELTGSGSRLTSDGSTHEYFFRIPPIAAPDRGRPVLIWLHGDGGTGAGAGSAFYPYTDPDGAVVLTPSGANRTWTHAAGDLPGQAQDAQFLSLLIAELATGSFASVPIDPGRIYLGGESRGAYMPYYLLMRASTRDRLAAVAVNAGLVYCQAGDAECDDKSASAHQTPSAILHLHGTNDVLVSPAPTASFHAPVAWNEDWKVFWPMNLWARDNGCFGGDNATLKDDGVLRESFTSAGHLAALYDLSGWGAWCSRYQLLLVKDGGHVIGQQEERIWTFLRGYERQ